MKRYAFLFFAGMGWLSSAWAADVVDLAGVWRVALSTNSAYACAVTVPGDVHTALWAAKKIPDPYWGCNETNVQWVAKEDWIFTRSFEIVPSVLQRQRIVLEMEDVDTFADVYLNDTKVGETSDRFARWTFDVRGVLKPGRNAIRVVFKSAWREADRRAARLGRKFPMSNVPWAKNQALIRKPACHAGWDWGLAQMTTGLCGPVKLVAHDGRKLDYVYTEPAFNDDLTHCELTIYADVTESDGRSLTVTNRVSIDHPPLWWPNGAGEQRFYTFVIDEDGVVGRKVPRAPQTRRIGLRKIEIVNTPDVDAQGKAGARMAVRVNGRELFMKGANWIPCDAFESRQTAGKYRNLLESAAAANMNMIRLWGGGQFEHDAFYDLCDELGLLVWHDQMFSCAVYPADETFLAEVRNELRHQIRRLRDHASIALWCGDNECVGALNWWEETKGVAYYKDALMKRHAVQEALVAQCDPTRMFWPSSPCAGPGNFADNWKNDSQGDMHNWQVWHENRPFDAYYEYSPRFCSEFGYQSFPSLEVAETFATREQILSRAPEFEWHQKNAGGNRRIRETMGRYFPPPKDVESELLLSQFQQGMAIKMAVDGWRAQRPRCMGTLFWQLNDNWPVASWSSIEYGGKWKALQYMAKRFYAPVAVVAQPAIDRAKHADVSHGKIYALNDTSDILKGELTVEHWTYGGQIVSAETKAVTLQPDSSTEVGAFDRSASTAAHRSQRTFLVMTLKTPRGTYQNDWHFGFYKDMPIARARIQQTFKPSSGDAPSAVELSTDAPAFFVWANARGVAGEFDDNCFTLLPGRPRTLHFSGALQKAPTVVSLADLSDPGESWNVRFDDPTAKIVIRNGNHTKNAEGVDCRWTAYREGLQVANGKFSLEVFRRGPLGPLEETAVALPFIVGELRQKGGDVSLVVRFSRDAQEVCRRRIDFPRLSPAESLSPCADELDVSESAGAYQFGCAGVTYVLSKKTGMLSSVKTGRWVQSEWLNRPMLPDGSAFPAVSKTGWTCERATFSGFTNVADQASWDVVSRWVQSESADEALLVAAHWTVRGDGTLICQSDFTWDGRARPSSRWGYRFVLDRDDLLVEHFTQGPREEQRNGPCRRENARSVSFDAGWDHLSFATCGEPFAFDVDSPVGETTAVGLYGSQLSFVLRPKKAEGAVGVPRTALPAVEKRSLRALARVIARTDRELLVDVGRTVRAVGVRFDLAADRFQAMRGETFQFEISQDGNKWTRELEGVFGERNREAAHPFRDPVVMRYWRLAVTGAKSTLAPLDLPDVRIVESACEHPTEQS